MASKKYISLSKLSTFLDNLKDTFSPLSHTHTISDIEDVDDIEFISTEDIDDICDSTKNNM